ncbi:MAG: polyprenyl synthetase family protein, partial [Bacteroidales bacterium]|nr:polyprenyl synthetase family protein [Bacteroidales bacterium]
MGLKKNTSELVSLVNTQINNLDFPETPALLYQPVKYILGNAGKRLRPILFLHAIQLFFDLQEIHFLPAAGLEIFHNFTLIHDDIMDKADIRRHQPTIHKKWNENVAILSGDAAMILATKQFLPLPEKVFKPVIAEFNKMALEICEGQQYDMDFEIRDNVTIDEYLKMIRLKTAVFLASALKMGAIVGNAPAEQQQFLYDAGINFGLAFQLQDDFLDTFGNLETFGKKPGGDILEKKKNFLM